MDGQLIISILSFLIGFLSFLLSIFFFTVKSENRISNLLIASYLMLTAMDISVFYYHNFITLPPVLEMLRIRSSAFKSPLLFLYILSVISSDFKFKKIHLLNIIPFLIGLIVLMPRFYLAGTAQQEAFFKNYFENPEIKILAFISYGISVIYIIACAWMVKRYKTLLVENYATEDAFSNYYFLKNLVIFIIIGFSLTSIKEVFLFNASYESIDVMRIIMLSFGLFFMSWLVLKAMHAPKLFRGVPSDLAPVKEMVKESNYLAQVKEIENQEIAQQITQLKSYMETEEPYLNASLTVDDLSKMIKIPARELSILINHHLDQHFFDFINEYRIKKAMKILDNPAFKKHTILEILYDVGFNSKSPFNAAFKKFTNLTPSQYRKKSIKAGI